jgi:predicted outer membrane repeat protein
MVVCLLIAAQIGSTAATHSVPSEYPTIAEALAVAASGDSVLVAAGVYYEHDLRILSGVTLAGETGDPADVAVEALFEGRVLDIRNSTDVVVSGIRLSGGFSGYDYGGACSSTYGSVLFRDVRFRGNASYSRAGAVFCENSTLTFERVEFIENSAHFNGTGGAVHCRTSTVDISDASFIDNSASLSGGGLYSSSSWISLENVEFSGNTSDEVGGALSVHGTSGEVNGSGLSFVSNSAVFDGGAIYTSTHCDPVFSDAVLQYNTAGRNGGAVYAWNSADPEFTNAFFWRNTASAEGGAVYCSGVCAPQLFNCTLAENASASGGAGVHSDGSGQTRLARCLVTLSQGGAGLYGTYSAGLLVVCSDVYDNEGGQYGGAIPDQTGLVGNISEDPLFCGLSSGSDGIGDGSPCASHNNSCGQLMGSGVIECGASAIREASWGGIKAIYR